MEQKRITEEAIQAFRQYLIRDEKSAVTVEKYLRDVRAFQAFIGETPVEKELVIHYKNHLLEESYAVRSIRCRQQRSCEMGASSSWSRSRR